MDLSKDPVLKHLPSEFLTDSFWSKSHVPRPSTFGASAKPTILKTDDRFALSSSAKKWKLHDEHGCSHGRIQVTDYWGKYHGSPPPGAYNPDHEKLSKREIGPKYTFPRRYADHYFEELNYNKKLSKTNLNSHKDEYAMKVRHNLPNEQKSELQKINIEDMRKSLLPGPGSYDAKADSITKFERTSEIVMNPRSRSTEPRTIMDLENAKIIKDRLKKNDKHYDADISVVMKKSPAYSLGALRPLLNQREYPPTGPGDYHDDRVFRMGQSVRVVTGVVKRK